MKKKVLISLSLIILTLCMSSCGKKEEQTIFDNMKIDEIGTKDIGNLKIDKEEEEKIAPDYLKIEEIQQDEIRKAEVKIDETIKRDDISFSIGNLSSNYLKNISNKSNIYYSPFSIASSLGILANGATNVAQKEILDSLSAINIDALNNNYETALGKIAKSYNNNFLKLYEGNILFVNTNKKEKGINISNNFKKNAQNYNGKIEELDFNNPREIKETLYSLSRKLTQKNISYKTTANEEDITEIFNMTYFDGKFKEPFLSKNTVKDVFYNENGTKSEISYLTNIGSINSFKYYETDKYEIVAIPYEPEGMIDICFFIAVIPKDNNVNILSLWNNETYIDKEDLIKNIIENETKEQIKVKIPKLEIYEETDITDIIKQIGVTNIFDEEKSNLNAIYLNHKIPVNMIKHIVKFNIEEQDPKIEEESNIYEENGEIKEVILNRPFFFTIYDNKNKIELISGVINNFD